MYKFGRWGSTFAVEILILAITAPVLYFPSYFPQQAPYLALGALALGWLWRRLRLNIWLPSNPMVWPLLLFLVMAPVALWASPPELRTQYSIPRFYILLWNVSLFAVVVTYSSRSISFASLCLAGFVLGGLLIAIAAPFGSFWLSYKIPFLRPILERIPSPLRGRFAGAEEGFHPNQIAGTLLYVLPMLMALTATRLFGRWFHSPVAESDASPASKRSYPWLSTILVVCTGIVGMTMLFTQSRSGLFGLLCGVLIMGLMSWPTGRRILVAGAILLVLGLPFFPAAMVEVISDAPQSVTLGDTSTLGFRQDVWQQALTAIHDFAYTGVGFGAFRKIMWLFYPIEVEYTDDIGHAHNFFMQTALDFGLIGMTALIAMWLVIFAQIVLLWSRNKALAFATWPWNTRVLAVSFLGSLIAQLVYSQLDAVAMGAKTNFFFWYLFALILGTANLAVSELHQPQAVEVAHPIDKNAGATSGAQSLGDLHSEPESAGAARQAA